MKKFTKTSLYSLCSLCLALGAFMRFHGTSFLFFGEPEYPEDKD